MCYFKNADSYQSQNKKNSNSSIDSSIYLNGKNNFSSSSQKIPNENNNYNYFLTTGARSEDSLIVQSANNCDSVINSKSNNNNRIHTPTNQLELVKANEVLFLNKPQLLVPNTEVKMSLMANNSIASKNFKFRELKLSEKTHLNSLRLPQVNSIECKKKNFL